MCNIGIVGFNSRKAKDIMDILKEEEIKKETGVASDSPSETAQMTGPIVVEATEKPVEEESKKNKPLKGMLSKETYKRIKHYSKIELETYLQMVYQNGMNDALGYFLKGLAIMLAKVPDLPTDTANLIMASIEEQLKPKKEEKSK